MKAMDTDEAGGGDRGEAEGARRDQQAHRRAGHAAPQDELDAREEKAAKEGKADGFDVAAKKALRKSVKDNALVRPELCRRVP